MDLIRGLPDGSAYVSAVAPARSWSEARACAALVVDELDDIWQAHCGVEPIDRAYHPHPWDAEAALAREARERAEARRAEDARRKIENTEWEAV